MLALGIDPGFNHCGWALVNKGKKGYIVQDSGTIQSDQIEVVNDRIIQVAASIEGILDTGNPDVIGVETLYIGKNTPNVLKVAELRGIIRWICDGRLLYEYHPGTVKRAVSGNGKATKAQMRQFIDTAMDIEWVAFKEVRMPDEYDAVAIAMCALCEVGGTPITGVER